MLEPRNNYPVFVIAHTVLRVTITLLYCSIVIIVQIAFCIFNAFCTINTGLDALNPPVLEFHTLRQNCTQDTNNGGRSDDRDRSADGADHQRRRDRCSWPPASRRPPRRHQPLPCSRLRSSDVSIVPYPHHPFYVLLRSHY